MTNVVEERKNAKKVVYPLNAKRVLIGLELEDADYSLLAYFNYINQFLKAKQIRCVHAVPIVNPVFPYQGIYADEVAKQEEEMHQELMEKMTSELNSVFSASDLDKLNFSVETGSPLETLLRVADETKADLTLIGQRAGADFHVIKSMNVVRMSGCNVLVAPEKARAKLKTILVPVDFSEHSIRALKTAVGFKHASVEPVRVIAIHVTYKLDPYTRGLGMISEKQERQLKERWMHNFQDFIEKHLPNLREDIETFFVEHDRPDVAPKLLAHAREYEADLIIMGAKGHSKLSLVLLGSTTEQLLRKNEELPVLVVK